MMHEVNMTCQIDAQIGAKAGKIEKKYDVRSVVCVRNKGRMQKGPIHRRTKRFMCMLVKVYMQ